jgi:hypothetical protein
VLLDANNMICLLCVEHLKSKFNSTFTSCAFNLILCLIWGMQILEVVKRTVQSWSNDNKYVLRDYGVCYLQQSKLFYKKKFIWDSINRNYPNYKWTKLILLVSKTLRNMDIFYGHCNLIGYACLTKFHIVGAYKLKPIFIIKV